MKNIFCFLSGVVFLLGSHVALATTTKIGNGDDGADLEGFELVTAGRLIEARNKGAQKLKDLNVPSMTGLGSVLPELERSPIYVSKRDVGVKLEEDNARFHSDLSGSVYARTFAEPHAPTRVFPVADNLNMDQLVSLLIHEALHRSLASHVRENEEVVSALTMAIAGPDSSKDRIQRVADRYLEEDEERKHAQSVRAEVTPIRKDAQVRRTSNLEYSYQRFSSSDKDRFVEVQGMHVLKSQLLAFGGARSPFGLGIQLGLIEWQNVSRMGPLGVSADFKFWTARGFDFLATAQASFNSLATNEFKNSAFGRDVGTVGFIMRKDTDTFYLENSILYSLSSEVSQRIEAMTYTHQYGGQGQIKVRAGSKTGSFRWGGYANVVLADYYRIKEEPIGGIFSDSGRFHIMSAGPEVGYQTENFQASIYGRWILSATEGTDYSYAGNLLGEGAGNGMIGISLGVSL